MPIHPKVHGGAGMPAFIIMPSASAEMQPSELRTRRGAATSPALARESGTTTVRKTVLGLVRW